MIVRCDCLSCLVCMNLTEFTWIIDTRYKKMWHTCQNETTLHSIHNFVIVNTYRSMYGFQNEVVAHTEQQVVKRPKND